MKIILSFSIMIAVFCFTSTADELLVPDEYATISDAVAASASGDVIRLVSQEVEWGWQIDIENKTLSIEGADEYKKTLIIIEPTPFFDLETKTLWLRNSHLSLRSIQVEKPLIYASPSGFYPSPIMVDSMSELKIDDCVIHCPIYVEGGIQTNNSELRGYSYVYWQPYWSGTRPIPSVLIQNATDRDYQFINTEISDEGYNALELRNLTNCRIKIDGINVQGGTAINERFRSRWSQPGGHGSYVINCNGIELSGYFFGGDASRPGYGTSSPFGTEPFADGGSGLYVEESSILFLEGTFYGGDGRNASAFSMNGYPGGNGGHGIHLVNSVIQYGYYYAFGGLGGREVRASSIVVPGGINGRGVFVDENSTFKSIDDETDVANWPLHE